MKRRPEIIGDAMKFMADLVAKLPAGVGYSWTGLSYQERYPQIQAPALYAISLVVVFLPALAALYESWSIPFSVMLVCSVRRRWRITGHRFARLK